MAFEAPLRRSPGGSPAPTPDAGGQAPVGELTLRLREIAAQDSAPEDLFEHALRAVVDTSPAGAGAICLFDRRHELLRLAAEVGLSDQGCRELRTVTRGRSGWDMPLHGLLNRRAYLIDNAARNRYVPPLVDAADSMRTVACLPLYLGPTPVGSLILIAVAPHVFAEHDIRALAEPVRELARMIEAARRHSITGVAPGGPSSTRPPAAVGSRRVTASATPTPNGDPAASFYPDRAGDPAASFHPDRAGDPPPGPRGERLVASERERARLATALEAVAGELAEQRRIQATVEATRASLHAAEVDRLTARLNEVEAALSRERRLSTEWDAERARAAAELEGAALREQRLREQLQSAADRAHPDRAPELRAAVDAVREAHESRTAAISELQAARADLKRLQTLVETLEGETSGARRAVESLHSTLASERHQAATTAAEGSHASARVAELERTLEAERCSFAEERETLTARLESAAAELQQVRAAEAEALARARQNEEEAARIATQLGQEVKGLKRERDAGQSALHAARRELTDERDGFTSRLARLGAELEQARTALTDGEAERAKLRAQVTEAAERARLEAVESEQAGQSERTRLLEQLAEAQRVADDAAANSAQLAHLVESLRGERATIEEALEAAQREHRSQREALDAQMEALAADLDQTRTALADLEVERKRVEEADAAERTRLTEETTQARDAAAGAAATAAQLEAEIEALRREHEAERIALDARLDTLAAERDALQEAIAAVGTPAPAEMAEEIAPEIVTAAPVPETAAAPAPAVPTPAPKAAAPAPRPAAPPVEPDAGPGRVAIIDTDGAAWEALGTEDCRLALLSPGGDAPGRFAAMGATRLLTNLAAPGALNTLAALRAAGVRASCWGCLADPKANRGITLGMIEPAARPLDPDAVLAALSGHAGKGSRVVTIGSDVDALMSLRQAMARQGMSVSMAWDANQAADLLALVRPDLVVIDMEQPARVAYAIVARLSATDPMPRLVLIAPEDDAGPGFAAEVANPAQIHRTVPLARVLAKVLGRKDAAPAARR
jgi:CheY-like chemotaxis protein